MQKSVFVETKFCFENGNILYGALLDEWAK